MRVFRTMLIRGDLMYPCGVQARVPCQSQAVVLIQLKVVDWDTPQAYAELSIPCLSSQSKPSRGYNASQHQPRRRLRSR